MNNHPPICPHCGNVDMLAAFRQAVESMPTTVVQQPDEALPYAEVALILHCGETKVRELVADGELPVLKLGATSGHPRIRRSDLEAWMEERVEGVRLCHEKPTAKAPSGRLGRRLKPGSGLKAKG